jgi:hypothetical protein
MPTIRTAHILGAVAAGSLLLATAATADAPVQPVVKQVATASPSKITKAGTPVALTINTIFSTNPPGSPAPTINKAVVLFPNVARTNGRFFPSCSAKQLTRAHNVLSKCPKGSLIGKGLVHALAVELNVPSIAKATLFNGPHGKSITFNFHATVPADINESFDAPLRRTHGKYGYSLTLTIPHSLQEILPGVFVSVSNFKVTTKGTVKVHGKTRGYIETTQACPKRGKAYPLHGDYTFINGTHTTSDTTIKCTG